MATVLAASLAPDISRKSKTANEATASIVPKDEQAISEVVGNFYIQVAELKEVPNELKDELLQIAKLVVDSYTSPVAGLMQLSSDFESKLRAAYAERLPIQTVSTIISTFTSVTKRIEQIKSLKDSDWDSFNVTSKLESALKIRDETNQVYFNLVSAVITHAKAELLRNVGAKSDALTTNLFNVDDERFEVEHLSLSRKYQTLLDAFSQINISLNSALILLRPEDVKDILQLETDLITTGQSASIPEVTRELNQNCEKILEMLLEDTQISSNKAIYEALRQEIQESIAKAQYLAVELEDVKSSDKQVLKSKLEVGNISEISQELERLSKSAKLSVDDPSAVDRGLIVLSYNAHDFEKMLAQGSVVITLRDPSDQIVGATICTPPDILAKRDPTTVSKLQNFGRVGDMDMMIIEPEFIGSDAYTILQRAALLYMQSVDADVVTAVIARDNQRSLAAAIREDWRIFPQTILVDDTETNLTTDASSLTSKSTDKNKMPFIGVVRPVAVNLREQSTSSMRSSPEFRRSLTTQVYDQAFPGIFELGWINSMEVYDKNLARIKYIEKLIKNKELQLEQESKSLSEQQKVSGEIKKLQEEMSSREYKNYLLLHSLRYESRHWPEYSYLEMEVIPAIHSGARWVRENEVFLYSDANERQQLKARYGEN